MNRNADIQPTPMVIGGVALAAVLYYAYNKYYGEQAKEALYTPNSEDFSNTTPVNEQAIVEKKEEIPAKEVGSSIPSTAEENKSWLPKLPDFPISKVPHVQPPQTAKCVDNDADTYFVNFEKILVSVDGYPFE